MGTIRILLVGGYWATNIGNAFYELGARYLLTHLEKNIELCLASDFSYYYWGKYVAGGNSFEPIKHSFSENIDYLVWMGPVFGTDAQDVWDEPLRLANENGVKVIFLSVGGNAYTEAEIEKCRKILKKHKPFALLSRDMETYQAYADCFQYSYDGICTAFWSPLCFHPWKIAVSPYVVYDFESHTEPCFLPDKNGFPLLGQQWKEKQKPKRMNRIRAAFAYNKKEKAFVDCTIVRAKNTCIPPFLGKYRESNVYLSDHPEDYLNLYKNAAAVFSDRVHACVGALAQGIPAMFYGETPRANLFKRVLRDNADIIYSCPTKVDLSYVQSEREKEKNFLKMILSEG